uniref:Uncharacterized protein n=1 Tax=Candidatus Kentrum sp. LFY TaxID=2126342 RepID=A0A450W6V4_9GAMM|nr:MAG: hypothetical protein BECKLFY1418C_GA0070996_100177 [Candidatus Kentron sp. LFY]
MTQTVSHYPVEIGRVPVLDETLLSDEVHRIDYLPIESWEENQSTTGLSDQTTFQVTYAHQASHGYSYPDQSMPVLSMTQPPSPPSGCAITRLSTKSAKYDEQYWTGSFWLDAVWGDVGIIAGEDPHTTSLSQSVLSVSSPLGSLDVALAPSSFEEIGRVPVLDETLLSDEIHRFDPIPIDDRIDNKHGVLAIDDTEHISISVHKSLSGFHCSWHAMPILSSTQPLLFASYFHSSV